MRNSIQLITYPNSLGKNLKELKYVLDYYLKDIIGGVHILPFYPSSFDRGFAPLTHEEVDKAFGEWEDIKLIGKDYELMVDFIMNHISSKSKYFQDFLKNDSESKYAKMFLTYEDFFKDNKEKEINKYIKNIYRPRDKNPFTTFTLLNNKKLNLWTTFSNHQIDLNWNNHITKETMSQSLLKLKNSNIKYLRLDAAGYSFKKINTSCFFLPETYDLINWIKKIVGEELLLIPEVHHDYLLQLQIANKCDFTYDFQIAIILLYTLYFSNTTKLKKWIRIRPKNMITVLDTHDGIGIIDGKYLLSKKELKETKEKLFENGGRAAFRASGKNSNNLDIYQINCTYFSALNNDDKKYLLLRAIQFFIPGIPQVYYVGLFAGKNDLELLNKTNEGRDINRHNYSLEEISKEVERPVVKKLFKLMKFRNNYQAFNGEFKLKKSNDETIHLEWEFEYFKTILFANFKTLEFYIKYTEFENGKLVMKDLEL